MKKRDLCQIEHDPNKDERRTAAPHLVQALVHAHVWLKSLSDSTYGSVEALARTADLHPKVIRNRIRLVFLAPCVVCKILEGTNRSSISLRELCKVASLGWQKQRGLLNKSI